MKSLSAVKIFLVLLFFISCAERELFTGPGFDPSLGGVYTELSGSIEGTLKNSDSPFLVSEDLIVESSKELIIEAGCELFFKQGTQLIVFGKITAVSVKNNVITFTSFESDWEGIHIISATGSSLFSFCTIENVYLPQDGLLRHGAIEIDNSDVEISNSVFKNNYAMYGGGISITNSTVTVKNNLFYLNEGIVYGGALFSQTSANKIYNNTVYNNFCLNFGGGFVFAEPLSEDVQNNIFYQNQSFIGDPRIEIVSGDSANVNNEYNFLAFGAMNPLFISADDNNFHLQAESPCINSGNPATEFNDYDGTRNDQGAYGGPNGNW